MGNKSSFERFLFVALSRKSREDSRCAKLEQLLQARRRFTAHCGASHNLIVLAQAVQKQVDVVDARVQQQHRSQE